MISRRRFLRDTFLGLTGAGSALGLYAWRWEPQWLEITRTELPIEHLPSHLDGATLAHLSDLHVGRRVDSAYLLDTFARVRALAPDIVVMTGDWVSYEDARDLEELRRLLDEFPRGRLGTFGVLGNHDYGFGWRLDDVANEITRLTRSADIQMLRDETAVADGLEIVGLEDYWGPHFEAAGILGSPAKAAARLVLCHNPDAADRPVWHGYRGWILAGHTHGGQCKPPFLPPPLLPVRNKRYTQGAIEIGDGRGLYISRGVGHLIRVRFNVRPEVAFLTLRALPV